ncbi:hypothetical protein Bca101_026092 [Brassica carinata]
MSRRHIEEEESNLLEPSGFSSSTASQTRSRHQKHCRLSDIERPSSELGFFPRSSSVVELEDLETIQVSRKPRRKLEFHLRDIKDQDAAVARDHETIA